MYKVFFGCDEIHWSIMLCRNFVIDRKCRNNDDSGDGRAYSFSSISQPKGLQVSCKIFCYTYKVLRLMFDTFQDLFSCTKQKLFINVSSKYMYSYGFF